MSQVPTSTLASAIERNRARSDIKLSSGRTIRRRRTATGYFLATPTTGAQEMTEAEWAEYCRILHGCPQ